MQYLPTPSPPFQALPTYHPAANHRITQKCQLILQIYLISDLTSISDTATTYAIRNKKTACTKVYNFPHNITLKLLTNFPSQCHYISDTATAHAIRNHKYYKTASTKVYKFPQNIALNQITDFINHHHFRILQHTTKPYAI